MAEPNTTLPQLEYHELPWGDLIYGTKHQLQALGLGVDRYFPGEPGGPVRQMTVVDPRGFRTTIALFRDTLKK